MNRTGRFFLGQVQHLKLCDNLCAAAATAIATKKLPSQQGPPFNSPRLPLDSPRLPLTPLIPPQPAPTVLPPLADLFPHELFPRTLVLVLGAVSPFVFTVIVQEALLVRKVLVSVSVAAAKCHRWRSVIGDNDDTVDQQ